MATISVIIPAYNAQKTILKTIESVQQQTYSNFELIVINDGSTDNTLEVVKSIKDERLKIFSYKNGGVAVARNRALSHASGEFIAPLDADDLWTPDKLELQLVALQNHPEAGVAYSWTTRFIDGQEESLNPDLPIYFNGNVYPKLLLYNFLSNGSNPLIRRKAIESVGEFDPACVPCEDWDFYMRVAVNWSFVVVPKHQILYRLSSNSGSANFKVIEKASFATIEKAYQTAPSELQYLKNQTLVWSYQYFAHLYLLYSKDISEINIAAKRLWKAMCLNPRILLEDYAKYLSWWLLKSWILMQLPQPVRTALRKKLPQ